MDGDASPLKRGILKRCAQNPARGLRKHALEEVIGALLGRGFQTPGQGNERDWPPRPTHHGIKCGESEWYEIDRLSPQARIGDAA